MINFVFFSIESFFLFNISGLVVQRAILGKFGKLELPFIYQMGLGALGLMIFCNIWHLGLPLTDWTRIAIWALLLIYSALDPRPVLAFFNKILTSLKQGPYPIIVLGVAFLSGFYWSLGGPQEYDTGLYHVQAVQWLKNFSVVPGLGNLHTRLAYNSTWFLLGALQEWGPFQGIGFHLSQPFLWSALTAQSLSSWLLILQARAKFSDLYWAMLGLCLVSPLITPTLLGHSPTFSSLFLAAVLSGWILWRYEQENLTQSCWRITAYFSIFSLTLKLVFAPTLLLLGWTWWRSLQREKQAHASSSTRKKLPFRGWQKFSRQNCLFLGGLCCLIWLPWGAHNFIQSGWWIYPFTALPSFDVSWRIPHSIALGDAQLIQSWAIWPNRPAAEVLNLTLLQWWPQWWARHKEIQGLQLFLWVVGLWGIMQIGYRRQFKTNLEQLGLVGVWSACFLLWFLKAPEIRYVLGIGAALWATCSAHLLWNFFLGLPNFNNTNLVPENTESKNRAGIFLACLALVTYLGLGNQDFVKQLPEYINFRHTAYAKIDFSEKVTLEGYKVKSPKFGDQCWNESLPCTPTLHPNLMYRGNLLSQGFWILP